MRTTNSHLNDMLYDLTPDNCDVCGCDDDEDDFEDGGDDDDDIEDEAWWFWGDDDDDIDFDEDDVDVDDTDGPGIIQDDITDGDELLPNLDNNDD